MDTEMKNKDSTGGMSDFNLTTDRSIRMNNLEQASSEKEEQKQLYRNCQTIGRIVLAILFVLCMAAAIILKVMGY